MENSTLLSPSPVIELHVNNHPGVMSHITGLFARRAFNLEGILCGALGDGRTSRMFLLVNEDKRLPQLVRELERLHDTICVTMRADIPNDRFDPSNI